LTADAEVNREGEHAEYQTNNCCDRQHGALSCGTSRSIDCRIVNSFERRLVEVTLLIRVRIKEEALGAAFHDVSVRA
jgi:hypothetical protein